MSPSAGGFGRERPDHPFHAHEARSLDEDTAEAACVRRLQQRLCQGFDRFEMPGAVAEGGNRVACHLADGKQAIDAALARIAADLAVECRPLRADLAHVAQHQHQRRALPPVPAEVPALAHDGQRALELAQSFAPQVILLDIGLPLLNGYEVAKRVREQPWGRGIKLIAVTGWGQEQDRKQAVVAGFDHHLTKPLDPARLATLLGELPHKPGAVLKETPGRLQFP